MIDSHSHIYAEEFDADRDAVIQNAINAGVKGILMPNIDKSSLEAMYAVNRKYPDYAYCMMGLHPCSVKEDYKDELNHLKSELESRSDIIAIGEIGIDLYWDKSTQKIQEEAFLEQCEWSIEKELPIVIHSRESIDMILDILENHDQNNRIKGVFHCFTGTIDQAKRIESLGMYMGLGGVLTFKNSGLREVLPFMNLDRVLIETDAPYLAPTPHRGKRNEPAYVSLVLDQISETLGIEKSELDEKIESNTKRLFKI